RNAVTGPRRTEHCVSIISEGVSFQALLTEGVHAVQPCLNKPNPCPELLAAQDCLLALADVLLHSTGGRGIIQAAGVGHALKAVEQRPRSAGGAAPLAPIAARPPNLDDYRGEVIQAVFARKV